MAQVFEAYPEHLRGFSASALMDFTPLSKGVKNHLVRVYGALTMALFAAALGAAVDMTAHVGGVMTLLASIGLMIYIVFSASPGGGSPARLAALAGVGFLVGLQHGSLIDYFLMEDPNVLMLALLSSAGIFLSLSVAAMFSDARTMLLTVGAMGAVATVSLMMVFSFLLFPTEAGMLGLLAVSLLMAGFYVLADTQMIIARAAYLGDASDYILDATMLFLDFVRLFIRVLSVLSKLSKKKE